MKPNVTAAFLALALTGLTLRVGAQPASAVNPTGTWKLTTGTNVASAQTLRLRLDGGKLTGTLSRVNGGKTEQYALADGKLQGHEISFTTHTYAVSYLRNVRQPTDTNKVTHSIYQGTIGGDTMKGKVERRSFIGQTHTLDWQARRVQ